MLTKQKIRVVASGKLYISAYADGADAFPSEDWDCTCYTDILIPMEKKV